MTVELTLLAWTLVLALFQIMAVAQLRSKETGLAYNIGPRDGPTPPMGKVTARLHRAQNNLFETLPVFAAAVLIAHAGSREGDLTRDGAWLYLLCRIVYIPLYAAGVPVMRTLTWLGSLIGIVMIVYADLR